MALSGPKFLDSLSVEDVSPARLAGEFLHCPFMESKAQSSLDFDPLSSEPRFQMGRKARTTLPPVSAVRNEVWVLITERRTWLRSLGNLLRECCRQRWQVPIYQGWAISRPPRVAHLLLQILRGLDKSELLKSIHTIRRDLFLYR